jgi:Rieske 2Fe-2S family protein
MNARSEMLGKLRNRRDGYTLAREFYTDPDYYRLDLENIFYREWLFAGHDCEVARPGAYMTLQVGDYPVVIVRSDDGRIRAFHNSCRHRGSRICSAGHGTAAKLTCPYHRWTYDLDGSLFYARDMGPGFDPAQHGLKPVQCESVAGYIWICLAPHAPELAPFRAQAEPYLAPHRLADAKIAFESSIVEDGNWKLVWENNRECYHCKGSHPELCKTFPDAPSVSGVEGADEDAALRAHWDKCEALGLPSVFRIDAHGQFRSTRMPLLRDAVSYTMTGQAAVRRRLSDGVTEPRIGTLLLFHFPTTWNHVLSDHAVSFRVLPLGPTQTQVTTKWLVHKDAVEGVDYSVEELTKVWVATNDQDRRIVEENQRGVNSPAFEGGPYSPVHETGVAQFVDWYAATMQRSLDDAPKLSRGA